ncbi:DUF3888 domain-containing protein [Paenibacillus germinis]|nr:DUF3888 domain-containing protein [Paenibacillus germinis]
MKKTIICLVLLFTVMGSNVFAEKKDPPSQEEKDQLLTQLLTPYIVEAVKEYYKDPRGIDTINILEITPEGEGYVKLKIKVQAKTFKGPHGPPYGLDTITFERFFNEMKVVKYEHLELKK